MCSKRPKCATVLHIKTIFGTETPYSGVLVTTHFLALFVAVHINFAHKKEKYVYDVSLCFRDVRCATHLEESVSCNVSFHSSLVTWKAFVLAEGARTNKFGLPCFYH